MNSERLSTYRLIAAAPLAAIASGAAADIVYTEVDVQFGGPGPQPFIESLQIGSIGVLDFIAGSNSDGPERVFGAKAGSSANIQLLNDFSKPLGGGSKSKSGLAARFSAGDLIELNSGLVLQKIGVGSAGVSSKSGKGPKGFGNFVYDGEVQSGYLGFAFQNPAFGDESVNYGWISVSWDGSFLAIDGFAYETDADTGIAAGAIPAPGAFGLFGLAAGAAGIRRKRQA